MVAARFAPNSLKLLEESIHYWQKQGYAFVDLPWIVEEHYTAVTRPPGGKEVPTVYGNLVASGEQSFLKLFTENVLPQARGYIGWTPCFRDEPVLDALHHFYFLKSEVFVPRPTEAAAFEELPLLLTLQTAFFEELIRSLSTHQAPVVREIISTHQVDLCLNGIEIGSYGVRAYEGCWYLYGTALALPRFTAAMEHD